MTHPVHTWSTGETITQDSLNNLEGRVTDAATAGATTAAQQATTAAAVAALPTKSYVDTADSAAALRLTALEGRSFSAVASSGAYSDLVNKPALAAVATSGAYTDLIGSPVIPTVAAGSGVTVAQSGGIYTVSAPNPVATDYGTVPLDSFQTGGLTDDQLLSAAMTAVSGDTYPRTITLTNRLHTFATGGITPYEGFRLSGAWGFSNPERNSGTKVASPVKLTMNGAWFTSGASTVFGVSLRQLALIGSGTNATFLGSGSGTWDCLKLGDIYSSGLRSLIGTQTAKALLTAAVFEGSWEINNCYSGAFHLGGSDNSLLWSQCLIDAAPAFATSGGSSGQAHFWADGLDKTVVGPMYITAESVWRGIRHDGAALNSGGTNAGSVQYLGLRCEGRNPSQPCNGSLIVQNGGTLELTGLWVAYGMASPSAGEIGAIQHNGGQLSVQGITYDTTNQAQTTGTPFLHTVGGAGLDVLVGRIKRASRGAVSWSTNRPIVARATAGAENRICDATVTQTTV